MERRIHQRFPTLSVIKTVEISRGDGRTNVPAIMCDISVGGLAMITFLPLPKLSKIVLDLNLPGINLRKVVAQIIRVEEKNGTYLIGLKFVKIPVKLKKKINDMALDWKTCEEGCAVGQKPSCSRCSYYNLCTKKDKKIYAKHQGSA
ncbi:MAG: PilZ domain-containing protein [bacterium]